MTYTKKTIKEALKNNGIKGASRALICSSGWVIVNNYSGKIENSILHLKPIDKNDTKSRHYVIQL